MKPRVPLYSRPDPTRSRDQGGFGLGLAIVRRCIDACGGTVAFRNRAGGGFEAEIRLRRAAQSTVLAGAS